MSVFVISHKPTDYPKLKGYELIQVGAQGKEHYCQLADDQGENISEKNPFFCELTGLYWIWKNRTDAYVGIDHYRRFFVKGFSKESYLSEKDIETLLSKNDIILPIATKLADTVEEQFLENSGTERDLAELESVIASLYPDYLDAYKRVLKGKKAYFRNMFVMKKELFDEYCNWMFSILFELEKRIDISEYDTYHQRLFGFISERLLTVFVASRNLKVCEIDIIQSDYDYKIKTNIHFAIRRALYYMKATMS